jgi:hypothetical protein
MEQTTSLALRAHTTAERRTARRGAWGIAAAALAGVLAATTACNRAERAFEEARTSRNDAALRKFIEEYPDSPRVAAARGHLGDVVKWNAAAAQGTAQAFQDYLKAFPEGLFASDARESIAFAEAKAADVVAAYEAFLTRHPQGVRGDEARRRVEALRPAEAAYRRVETSTEPAPLTGFIDGHPGTGYTGLAERRLVDVATGQAEAAVLRLAAYRGLPDRLDALEGYLRESAPAQRRLAEEARARVLLERTRIAGRASYVAPSIRTSSAPPLSKVVVLQDTQRVTVQGSFTGRGFGLTLRGLYVSRDGMLSKSIHWGTGTLIVGDPQTLIHNVAGSLTVSQAGANQFLVATYFPGDRLLLSGMSGAMYGRGSASVVLPGGDGSIYRFTGAVDGFFPQVRVVSSANDPLCFGLLEGFGLVYLTGQGTIQVGDANAVALPAPTAG